MAKITLDQYAMGRDALFPEDWILVKPNAERLLTQVNAFLTELFPDMAFHVSSGWRPALINEKIPNAAKHSLHMAVLAIDINDQILFLKRWLNPIDNPEQAECLRKYGLFMESRDHTPTWCHLDLGDRADRPSRVFIP